MQWTNKKIMMSGAQDKENKKFIQCECRGIRGTKQENMNFHRVFNGKNGNRQEKKKGVF